jgi:hypothetical protein
VLYSRDGSATFEPLRFNVDGSTAQVDTAGLGGGGAAIFRVVATDGVLSAETDSPQFTMANKPPVPRILSPYDGFHMRYGQLVNLTGEAPDLQDGVGDDQFVWSNQNGELGNGALLSTSSLPVGKNQIQLSATNRDGLSASATITVFVDDDLNLPGPTLSAGPLQVGWHVASGTTQPQTAEVQVNNSGDGTLSWKATSDAPWLTLSAASGTAPTILTLTANPGGVGNGATATANLRLVAPGAPGQPDQTIVIPVFLTVGKLFGSSGASAPPIPQPPIAPTLAPAAPGNVEGHQIEPHAVQLTWRNADDRADHFEIIRDGDAVGPNPGKGATRFVNRSDEFDNDPAPGGTYNYVVCAVSAIGRSCATGVDVMLK